VFSLLECFRFAEMFAHARLRLHSSTVPDNLPGREEQKYQILQAVKSCIENVGNSACLFISGVPGTGKTVTVLAMIKYLQSLSENGKLPDFKFVELNAMRLTDPRYAYCALLKAIDGRSMTPAHALASLEKLFAPRNNPPKRSQPIVVLLDELDVLMTKQQTILYHFFEWPTHKNAGLVVIGISNTVNLPEQMVSKIRSRLGVHRFSFPPYTREQLIKIIESRMHELEAFDPKAIRTVSAKIASVSGDVRRALDLCRRACFIAERQHQQQSQSSDSQVSLVTVQHVDEGIAEMFCSIHNQALNHSSLHEKLFVWFVVCELRFSGLMEATFRKVAERHILFCTQHLEITLMVPTSSQLLQVCHRLNESKLIIVENQRADVEKRILLNINPSDVIFVLRNDDKLKSVVQD